MKKTTMTLAAAVAAILMVSCATTGGASGLSLHDAIGRSAERLAADVPAGTRVAIVAFESESDALSDFMMEGLAGALVRLGIEVADRRNLEFVAREQELGMSGLVSDETAQRVGHMIGAEFVIVGRLWNLGSAHRLDASAIHVETAVRAAALGFDVRGDRTLRDMIAALEGGAATAAASGVDGNAPPQTAGAYLDRGLLFFSRGDFATAILDFTAAIRMNPDFASAYFQRGLAHYRRNEFTRAVADFTQAIRLNPNWVIAYNNRGLAQTGRGAFDMAIADFTQALRLDPNFASAYSNRGNAHHGRGDLDMAIADYPRAIMINPDHADARFNRGSVHLSMGRLDPAIADLSEAIRLNPGDHRAFVNRGNAHRDRGDFDLAIADYEAALRISPNSAVAARNLEDVLRR